MRYAVKNKKNIVKAYQLGVGTEMEKQLVEEGAIRLTEDGRYELFSQEVKGHKGQLAEKGDYFKVDVVDGKHFPYNNNKSMFEQNHRHIAGDEYEQIVKPVKIWEALKEENEPYPKEIQYLLDSNLLTISPDNTEQYYSAKVWGTTLTQSKDGVLVIYSVGTEEMKAEKEGGEDNEEEITKREKITSIDFGLISGKEFKERYTVCEHHVLMMALSTFNQYSEYVKTEYRYYNRSREGEPELLYHCDGYYQLEPIPQFICDYLEEPITDLILLETKDVRTDDRRKKVYFRPGKEVKPETILEDITVSEYYKTWIKNRLGNMVNIIEIPLDEIKPAEALSQVIQKVQELYKETKDKNAWRMWIDTHGGFRDISLVLASAARFFAVDKELPIQTDGIYTVYHSQKAEADEIINQSAFYFTESTEAMKKFLNYGQYIAEKFRPYEEGTEPYAFVSYRHDADAYVSSRNLLAAFQRNGIRFWYDKEIGYRDNWEEKIRKKNQDARVFVALLSDSYFESVECWKELLFAISKEKRLLQERNAGSSIYDRIYLFLLNKGVSVPQSEAEIPGEVLHLMKEDFHVSWEDLKIVFGIEPKSQLFQWFKYMGESIEAQNPDSPEVGKKMQALRDLLGSQ